MKIAFNTVGVLMALFGTIWFLQGINLLKGSPMTGETRWVVIGAAVAVGGVLLLLKANWRRQRA
jgi:hypothetical protein